MKEKRVRYIWIPILISIILIPAGFYFVNWSKSGEGAGLYSHDWLPEDIFAYWNTMIFINPFNQLSVNLMVKPVSIVIWA